MKRIVFVLFLLYGMPGGSVFAEASPSAYREDYILIISSGSEKQEWASRIGEKLSVQLKNYYPESVIYLDYLASDKTLTPYGLISKMRTIFQSRKGEILEDADVHDSSLSGGLSVNTNGLPSVMIFIGDDIWRAYREDISRLREWKDIPVVLCGASNEIYDGMERNALSLVPSSLFREKTTGDPESVYRVNVSGVLHTWPLRQNLELIKELLPEVENIIFLDKQFYTTEYIVDKLRNEIHNFDPSLNFSVRYSNWLNADSIFYEMLGADKQKTAYLSHSWTYSGANGHYTDEEADSLRRTIGWPCVFYLTDVLPVNDRVMGGYYYSQDEYVARTMRIVRRVLEGNPVNTIPFDSVRSGRVCLNQAALKFSGLEKQGHALKNTIFRNIPPSFYEVYEGWILFFLVCCLLLVSGAVLFVRRYRHTKRAKRAYLEYKKLYSELHLIYEHLPIYFGLYDRNRKRIERIVENTELFPEALLEQLLAADLFESTYIDDVRKKLLKAGQSVNFEVKLTQGTERIFQLFIKPLEKSQEKEPGYIVIVIDKTPEMQEREEREYFENLFDFAADISQVGIACYNVVDGQGFASSSWFANLHEPYTENPNPSYRNVKEEDRNMLLRYRQQMKEGRSVAHSRDIQVYSRDGMLHWIRQYLFLYEYKPEDRKIIFIELNLNVDHQKQGEINLKASKEKAEEAAREKEHFLASINHEIRTPLNAIVGFAGLFVGLENESEKEELGDILRKNNELLALLIDDVIELSEIDSGKAGFLFVPVNVKELFTIVCQYAASRVKEGEVELSCKGEEKNLTIESDEVRILQVYKRLILNALKFTERGKIEVGFRDLGESVYFYVSDTGCGIEEARQEDIFRRFVKINSFVQGSGLGLSLCQSIVKALGGEIGVQSVVGKGSTFWFQLPHKKRTS